VGITREGEKRLLALRLVGSESTAAWEALVAEATPVAGIPVGKTLDVDRPADLREAEVFVEALQW
jgi:hypothetical protein